jgi:serine/threonine protein kinase
MLPLRIGRFRVTEHLGSGGMGEVYKAYDEKLHRWVAIKAILPTRSLNPDHRERLRCEAQAAAAISHNTVAKIYDLISEGDHDYLVFELVEGESLRSVLLRGPVPMAQAFSIGLDIAEGLEAAHASGVVHRDLKLDNVMITPEGRAKILDLGLAKVTESAVAPSEVSSLPGTLSAMSPEQIRHRGDVDFRSDLFSFGTLLYQLVTNKHPFREGLPPVTLSNILSLDPPAPHKIKPEVPLAVSRLILRLLAKEPRQRPASARDAARRLRRLEQRRLQAETAKARERSHRRWKLFASFGAVAIVVLIIVSLLALQATTARREADLRRSQAEDLIDFMLLEQQESLARIGRVDLLAGVAQSADRYFSKLPPGEDSPERRQKRGSTYLSLGEVFLEQGETEQARENPCHGSPYRYWVVIDYNPGVKRNRPCDPAH